jgi:hypothetical protein
MKQRIIKALKIGGIFICGIIVGAILLNLLDMYLRPTYREIIRIDLKVEQEFLASRAMREGDKVRALAHRWNVVDAEAKDGFRAFRKEQNKKIDSLFSYPFYMLIMNAMMHDKEGNLEKGARVGEGIDRGRLASALESIGANAEADKQWERARILICEKKSIEDTKKLIHKLQEDDNTELHLQAEKAVLGEK